MRFIVWSFGCVQVELFEHIIVNLRTILYIYEVLSSYTIALYQFRHRRDYAVGAAADTLIAQYYTI